MSRQPGMKDDAGVIPPGPGRAPLPPGQEPAIEATFRNGTLTAISVVLGFSLSFLNRWAGLPGRWDGGDLVAVAAISAGIAFQIAAVASMLSVRSLALKRYDRSVRLFLAGLALVALGVAIAITDDILGLGQNVIR